MSEPVNRAGPPRFDLAVPAGGYRWWYLDAVSDDARHALVIIAFVGSVFSPYYFSARRKGADDPRDFCAVNVAVYGPGGRWCMTERRAGSIRQDRDRFGVGPSNVRWNGERLVYELQERSAPLGRPLRGRVEAIPGPHCDLAVDLDAGGRHRWTPWSPRARVEVTLEHPRQSWSGSAYLDANAGSEPLERAFHSWDWSRTEREGATRLHYAVRTRDGAERVVSHEIAPDGTHRAVEAWPVQPQRRTGWGLRRYPRPGHEVQVVRGLEDTPFYARTLFTGPTPGEHTVYERLDMDRFLSPWVRLLLPFRMPREWRGGNASLT